jgi:hypothetical protein
MVTVPSLYLLYIFLSTHSQISPRNILNRSKNTNISVCLALSFEKRKVAIYISDQRHYIYHHRHRSPITLRVR